MKGLLIKDFRLMKAQKNFFVLILLVPLGAVVFTENNSFVIGYMTFVGSLFTLSSISYDEFENGSTFLFTLPITRKDYAVEKYEFGLLLGGGAWALATLLVMISGMIKHTGRLADTAMEAMMILPFLLVVLALLLPFEFKFGSEKSRIAVTGVFGLLAVIAVVVVKIAECFHVDLIFWLNHLPVISMGGLIVAGFVIGALILLISCKISIRILKKKEF